MEVNGEELRELGKDVARLGAMMDSLDRSTRDDHACILELKGMMTGHVAREEADTGNMKARIAILETESRRLTWRVGMIAAAVGSSGGGAAFGLLKLIGSG